MKNEERVAGFFILHSKFEILHSSAARPSSALRAPSPGGRRLSLAGRVILIPTVGALYREFEQTLEL
ncbi:MAG TPA: hypothetical protein VII12_03995, partial [Thermoanaerobaculia bacterium]